jgi:hypothetical protein
MAPSQPAPGIVEATATGFPALEAAELDPHSPALLDVLDALHDPVRVGLVERSAVVSLVSALYSTLMIAPVDDDGHALDPYALARQVSSIFAAFLNFALDSDIETILAEAETLTCEKLESKRPTAPNLSEESKHGY